MELRIFDKDQFVTVDFGRWLIPKITTKIISSIDKQRLLKWDNYFSETDVLKTISTKIPKTFDIIVFIAHNLTCSGTDGEIFIEVSKTAFVPGLDRVKAETIAKLINYGNLEMEGYSIFTDSFNQIAQDIDSYVGLYYDL